MIGIIKKDIQGKIIKYTELFAEQDFCFYDADVPENERNYMTYIATPITDTAELERKFIAVKGNAEELNEALQREMKELDNGKDRY